MSTAGIRDRVRGTSQHFTHISRSRRSDHADPLVCRHVISQRDAIKPREREIDGDDRDKRVAKENIKVAIVANTSICHVDQMTAKLMANSFRDIKLFLFLFFRHRDPRTKQQTKSARKDLT